MENVLRRNSRTSNDSVGVLDGGRRTKDTELEEESVQSQKKQRIVSFDQGVSSNMTADAVLTTTK